MSFDKKTRLIYTGEPVKESDKESLQPPKPRRVKITIAFDTTSSLYDIQDLEQELRYATYNSNLPNLSNLASSIDNDYSPARCLCTMRESCSTCSGS